MNISTQVLGTNTNKTTKIYTDFDIQNFKSGNLKSGASLILQNISIVIGVMKTEVVMNVPGIGSRIMGKLGSLILANDLNNLGSIETELYEEIENQVPDVTIDRTTSTIDIYADENAMSINLVCIIDDKSYIVKDYIGF